MAKHSRKKGFFRNLTIRHWGWVHFKLTILYWASVMFRFTPEGVYSTLQQPIVAIWTILTALGAIISVTGLMFSAQPRQSRFHTSGVSIELAGLLMFITGPIVYWITQLSLIMDLRQQGIPVHELLVTRYALVVYSYAMVAAILARILVVLPRFLILLRSTRDQRGDLTGADPREDES
jgi:hypothetical protein